MARRGFTLLELLLAIGLLLAIAAIAVPVAITSLDAGVYGSTVEMTKASLLHARAHAQATGRPVEVVYRPAPPRLESRAFDAETGGLDEDDRGELLPEDWAYRPLPRNARLTRQPPPEETGAAALAAPLDSGPEEDEETPIRLAVYLPDGSALLAEPVWIVAGDGPRGRLVVNPWSGLPALRAGGATDADEEEDEEDLDEPDEEDEDDFDPRPEEQEPASDRPSGRETGADRPASGDPARGEGGSDDG